MVKKPIDGPLDQKVNVLETVVSDQQNGTSIPNSFLKFFRSSLFRSEIILAQCDRDLRYTWVFNPHPDFRPESVIGKRDVDLADNEGARRLEALKRNVLEKGRKREAEISFSVPGGFQHFNVYAEPILDDDGQVQSVTICALSKTQIRLFNDVLEDRENKFRQLSALSPGGIYQADINGDCIYANPSWLKMAGMSFEEAKGRGWINGVHPDDRSNIEKAWYDAAKTGGRWGCEYRFVNSQGKSKWVYGMASPIKDVKGNITGYLGFNIPITKRKLAEEKLKETSNRLKQAQKLAKIGYWDWELATNQLTWSDEVYDIFGQDKTRFYPTPESFESCIHPDDYHRFMDEREVALKENKSIDLEHRIQLPDGSVRHIHELAEILRDTNEEVVGVAGTVQDITTHKLVEEALRDSEKHVSSIFRSAPVGIGLVVNRVITKANRRLCEMTGFAEKELINQSARILYPDDEAFHHVGREKYAQIVEHGTGTVETRWQRKDGVIIDVLLSSTPIDMQDLTMGVTFTALDISDRRRAEAALRESEERYRRLFENSVVGIFSSIPKGQFLYVNTAFADMLGYDSPDDLVSSISDIATQYYAVADDRDGFQKILKEEGHIENFEFEAKCKNGSTIWASSNVLAYFDEEGVVTHYEGIVLDITSRKRAEAESEKLQIQLRQAQKMEAIGTLAGGVAHDYNNMLSVIIGFTEIVFDKTDVNDPSRDDLKEVMKAARRSVDITRQLLAFARKQTIRPIPLDLNQALEAMLMMLRRLIGEDIDLSWHPGHGLGPIFMDPSQLDQILANLCVNARDAIGGVGKLTIETGNAHLSEDYCADHVGFVPGDFVLLAVNDDGCGMGQETLDNLFDPFFTTKAPGEGTGLGLATVYGIVKQNDGFINVYSELGDGTTFKIYLPIHVGDKQEAIDIDVSEIPLGQGETVLVVEDEPSILKLSEKILDRLGYHVLRAATPDQAKIEAKEHGGKIHLLITDVVMPEMNGHELADQLRRLYSDLKVLFMSGYTANAIAHRGVLDDGVNFIQKPFSKRGLAIKVRGILDKNDV